MTVTRDFRQALRALLRTPGFTAVAVLTLGIAIGVNVGLFSVVDAVLLDPLPYAESERLVSVFGSAPGSDFPEEFPLAAEHLVHFRERSGLIEEISTFNSFTNTLRVGDRIERVRMSAPTVSLFDTLGVQPAFGRLPVPEDEDRVMVISHRLWTTWLGSDPEVVGRAFYAGGSERVVIGVMGPDFWFPDTGTLLWVPQNLRVEDIVPGRFGQPFVARLAPGAEAEALAAELARLSAELPERFGGSAAYARLSEQLRPIVRPLADHLLGSVAGPLWILLAAMGVVLVIACANVANLFMVRAERRQADLAVRRALGASRGRLIREQMAEATVVAGLAGGLAVAFAAAGVPLLLAAAPVDLPRMDEVVIGPATLLFTYLVSVITAFLCGLAPAVRFSAPSLARRRDGGRGATRRRGWSRHALVVAQTALALVLLISSALLGRSFEQLRDVDPGYDTRDVFTFQIAPEGAHLQDDASYARFHLAFMDRLAALPGVERVGIVENFPLNEGLSTARFVTEEAAADEDGGSLLSFTWAAGDYFQAMGIEVLEGRTLTADDQLSRTGNVLISRSAAELLWPGEEAIGRRLRMQDGGNWETVVGVVDDVLQYGFRRPAEPMVYLPLVGQDAETGWVISSPAHVVKTSRAAHIAPEIRALVRQHAPLAPMYRTFTLEGLAADSMRQLSFTALTLGIASALALILGVVGLYGVLSYAVAERTREIGLRMALGAAAHRVRWMIVRQGLKVVIVGLGIGAALAYGATRALDALLFGVEAFDAGTWLAVSALTGLVALAASYLPARRASRVDPMTSLRTE